MRITKPYTGHTPIAGAYTNSSASAQPQAAPMQAQQAHAPTAPASCSDLITRAVACSANLLRLVCT